LTTEIDYEFFKSHEEINITSAVGDIFIRTAAWLQGAKINNGDLYDACLCFIETKKEENIKAVVCVRARSCDCPLFGKGVRQRGNSHPICPTKQWRLFIPCGMADSGKSWAYIHSHATPGRRAFELLSDAELNSRFATKAFRISIQNTDQLRATWNTSYAACKILLEVMNQKGTTEKGESPTS
jgi:hypothetical protein